MAAVKLLLSQARRHCLYRSTNLLRPSSSAPLSKPFSSSSPESPPPPPNDTPTEPRRREPISIQPVSYAVKPKEEQPPSPESGAPEDGQRLPPQQRLPGPSDFQARTSWTREDARYVKDGPEIAPVSYPARVAPLPEDKPFEEERNESTPDEGREFGMQRRRIERDGGMIMMRRRRGGRMYEDVEEENEKEKLPFPAPIKVVKNERKPIFDLNEALRLVKENAKSNFDETVEAHVRLGIDRKRSDLIVRGSMLLPHGEGMKVSKIAFLGEGVEAEEARAAGADIVGGLELVEKIANSGGKFAVQKCFTTPAFMPNVLKIAKVLKPLGLLPNAKQGTLVSNVTQAVKDAKQSNVDFRMDKSSIVHVGLGKVSLSEAYLRENIGAFVNALLRAKPAGLKKASKFAGYVDAFHICSTMGPGFAVSIQSLSKAADNYSKANL